MSEVYIRSQNKEKLYRLGGNYACVEYGEYEDIKKKRGGAEADKKRHVICISDGCLEEIGEYATKERCLEVLDEIQKACVSYLFTAGGAAVIRGGMDVQPFAAVIPRLYEMPEKKERQTVTVEEFIGTLESSDRLRIIKGKAEVYVGYLAAFKPFADHEISEEYRKYSEHEVKKFRAVPEITHRRWKELGLMKPLEPDQTAQYKFSDLQMSLYYTIYI